MMKFVYWEKLLWFCSEKSRMTAQFLDQKRTIEEKALPHLCLSAKTKILITTLSHFKILLAAKTQTAVLSVELEVQLCRKGLQRYALSDTTLGFGKDYPKGKSHLSSEFLTDFLLKTFSLRDNRQNSLWPVEISTRREACHM